MDIQELQQTAWTTAQEKGFHDDLAWTEPRLAAMVRLALIHTEVSEVTQEVKRHGVDSAASLERIGHELADILIRVADLAEVLGVSLDARTQEVLALNARRPYQYGTPNEARTAHTGGTPS